MLAVDGAGRPALLLHRTGAGSAVLCTYPVEHMAAVTANVNPDATVRLYSALAAHAGLSVPVQADDPRVASDVLVRSDGKRFAWLVSQSAEPLTVTPRLGSGLRLRPLEGGAGGPGYDDAVPIAPFGVSVSRLEDAGAAG